MRFCHLPTATLLLSLAISGCERADRNDGAEASAAPAEWVIACVMSFGNDLEYCGPVILEAMRKGLTRPGVKVTGLADDTGRGGLVRHVLTNRGHTQRRLDTDDSASEKVLEEYFDWVAREHPARHYAVIFLDHGGELDDMCQDEWRGRGQGGGWLSARRAGDAMRRFREKAPGQVRLVFLQQCGRATVDNLYNFRGAVDAVMASQLVLGAPNTYYTETLRWLAEHTDASGVELARQIMTTDEHFTHYVCVNGKRLEELPARVAPVVELLRNRPLASQTTLYPCFIYGREASYDLLQWLEAALAGSDADAGHSTLADFSRWIEKDLIVAARTNPGDEALTQDLCGLSLWVPPSHGVLQRYPGYPFHTASGLDRLWANMLERQGGKGDITYYGPVVRQLTGQDAHRAEHAACLESEEAR